MQDINQLLLVMQSSSLAVSLTLCLMLVLSRFQKPDTTRAYENVRWLLVAATFSLAVHFALQILCGFRAQGDDVGALVNILFYSPIIYVLSYSIVRIGCGYGYHRRYLYASIISLLLILGTFAIGYIHYRSLHMMGALHMAGVLFFFTMVYFITYPIKEFRRIRKIIDEESGEEPVQFNQYMRTGAILLDIACFLVPFAIFYTPALVIFGPLFFAALIYYIMCFIALGFNIMQVKNIIVTNEPVMENAEFDSAESVQEEAEVSLTDEQNTEIRALLDSWRQAHGYESSDITCASLAVRLNVSRTQLINYLRTVEGKTFRMWLSDLRFEEAKQLMSEHPEYTNEAIAEACGFSRSYFQQKFKETTGYTVSAWREMNK